VPVCSVTEGKRAGKALSLKIYSTREGLNSPPGDRHAATVAQCTLPTLHTCGTSL